MHLLGEGRLLALSQDWVALGGDRGCSQVPRGCLVSLKPLRGAGGASCFQAQCSAQHVTGVGDAWPRPRGGAEAELGTGPDRLGWTSRMNPGGAHEERCVAGRTGRGARDTGAISRVDPVSQCKATVWRFSPDSEGAPRVEDPVASCPHVCVRTRKREPMPSGEQLGALVSVSGKWGSRRTGVAHSGSAGR